MYLNGSTTGFLLQTMLYLANKTDKKVYEKNLDDFLQSPMGADSDPDAPRCYQAFGCFPIEYPWTTENRPVSYYPQKPSEINTKYPVYTKHNRHLPKYLNLNEPSETKFTGINPNGKIYFIAHGYIDTGDRPWVKKMMNALLDNDDTGKSSVIVVDWGHGSSPPYTQAVANIRLVGVITAHVMFMIKEQLNMKNLDNVHMLGHSLGSHLSAYAGDTLQKQFGLKLGRITAMDPAEPLFTDTEPVVRLDRNDAKFVDVIHTDTGSIMHASLGMSAAIGHVDFYPNGGNNNPGCSESMEHYIQQEKGSFFWGIQQFFSCNHLRSHQFMTESILTKHVQQAVICQSYEDFRDGHCFSCNGNDAGHCISFGLDSERSYKRITDLTDVTSGQPLKAYFMTSAQPPYFQSHYKISVYVSDSEESVSHGGEIGVLSVEIESTNDEKSGSMKFSKDPLYFEPGYDYSAVLSGKETGLPKSAMLHWDYQMTFNPLSWRVVSPRIYIKYIVVESLEHSSKATMCPMHSNPVVENAPTLFQHDYCNSYQNL